MKIRLLTLLCILALVVFAADVTGKWSYEAQGRGGPQTVTLTLKQDGKKLTGSMGGGRGGDVDISGRHGGRRSRHVLNHARVQWQFRHDEVLYEVLSKRGRRGSGAGITVDMSSKGILFTTSHNSRSESNWKSRCAGRLRRT